MAANHGEGCVRFACLARVVSCMADHHQGAALSLLALTAALFAPMPALAAHRVGEGESQESSLAASEDEGAQKVDTQHKRGKRALEADKGANIIVTARRAPQAAERSGLSVSVIDLGPSAPPHASDPASLLHQLAGVNLSRNGGLGAVAGLSIRGALADHTAVLVDGVKINDPASPGAGFDFGPMTLGSIRRIELVRGAQSVLYGSQAMGGVVNFITASPGAEPGAVISGELGSRDHLRLAANVSTASGPLRLGLGGHYLSTDGISAFNAARGGRERDGFRSRGGNARLELDLSEAITVEARGFYARSRADIDGFPPPLYQLADSDERAYRRDFVGYAGVKARAFDGRLMHRLGIASSDIKRRSVDGAAPGAGETFASAGRNQRYEYQATLALHEGLSAVFGAEREESRYQAASYGGPQRRAASWINSIYGQVELALAPGLSLTGGLRRDTHKSYGSQLIFAASGVYSPDAGTTLIRASYGEGFKAPSLFQLYSDYGNSALRPERSRDFDASLTRHFARQTGAVSLTYFRRRSLNLVRYVSCYGRGDDLCTGRPFGTYDNIGRARAKGFEAALTLTPTEAVNVTANYTRLSVYDEASGAPLARQPQDKLSFSAEYRPDSGLMLGGSLLIVGDSFEDSAGRQRLDGYALAGLNAAYNISENVMFYMRIDNLFDVSYETALGYGQPGRGASLGLRWAL